MTNLADFKLDLGTIARVMDEVPDTVFFVKGRDKRYVAGNGVLAQVCGLKTVHDLIGRSTNEFFPEHIVERYEELDIQVMGDGLSLHNRLDLTIEACGRESWFLYSRLPLAYRHGEQRAAMGMSRRLPSSKRQYKVYERLYLVSEMIFDHFTERWD
jgi:hypothetical protein